MTVTAHPTDIAPLSGGWRRMPPPRQKGVAPTGRRAARAPTALGRVVAAPAPFPRARPRGDGANLFTVATYNLLDGGMARPDKGLRERLPAQLTMLAALDLDVLCLQECKHWDRDRHQKVFRAANALGMQPLFAPSASHGCHLVTRYRWPRVRCLGFTPDIADGDFHHTASFARFQIAGGDQPIDVAHTHLNPFDPAKRTKEARRFIGYATSGCPAVPAGDLNVGQPIATTPACLTACIHPDEHSRHLIRLADGTYSDKVDTRALHVLLNAGFVDPPSAPRTTGPAASPAVEGCRGITGPTSRWLPRRWPGPCTTTKSSTPRPRFACPITSSPTSRSTSTVCPPHGRHRDRLLGLADAMSRSVRGLRRTPLTPSRWRPT
ncbi:endonuclease/exonuclease/phosphatase family protein [Streptomyces sp. NPDC057654]|uniref:endonuclease/exonuclease/phosphatase family protein n=1 Tax=Streptomyces sp. NPDC057654 TaxID=3346196 RepID=UPI0036C13C9C